MEDFVAGYAIPFAYIIFGIALLSALAFPAIQLFADLKKAIITFASIAGMAAIYVLCFVLATGEPLTLGENYHSAELIKFVNASLFMGYLTFVIAILAIIYSAVSNVFK